MEYTKRRAELLFEASTKAVIRFRLPLLVLLLLFTGFSMSQLRHLGIDTSNEGFLHDDDPILLTYNEFRDQFGRDDMLDLLSSFLSQSIEGVYKGVQSRV